MNISVEYTIDLVSSANKSGKLKDKMARVKRHREAAYVRLLAKSRELCFKPPLPCLVVLTRIGSRLLDNHDNLKHSLKATVDGVATLLGVNDNDDRVFWQYRQFISSDKLSKGQSIVRIEISDSVCLAVCSGCKKTVFAIEHQVDQFSWIGLPEGWLRSGIFNVCSVECALSFERMVHP